MSTFPHPPYAKKKKNLQNISIISFFEIHLILKFQQGHGHAEIYQWAFFESLVALPALYLRHIDFKYFREIW